jgi:hypothetical protein
MSLDHYLSNVATLHGGDKFAEDNFRFAQGSFAENEKNHYQSERQD